MEEERRKDRVMFQYAVIICVTFYIVWIWLLIKGPFIVYTVTMQNAKIKEAKIRFLVQSISLCLFYYIFLSFCCKEQILRFIFYYGLLGAERYMSYNEALCTYYLCFNIIVLVYVIPIISAINVNKKQREIQIQEEPITKRHGIILVGYTLLLTIGLLFSRQLLRNPSKVSNLYAYAAECMIIYMQVMECGIGLWFVFIIIVRNLKKKIVQKLESPIIMFFGYTFIFSIHMILAYFIHKDIKGYLWYSYRWIFAFGISASSILLSIILSLYSIKKEN